MQTNVNTTDGISTQETDEAAVDRPPPECWSVLCVNTQKKGVRDQHIVQCSAGKYSRVVWAKCRQLWVLNSIVNSTKAGFRKNKMSNNLHFHFKYTSTLQNVNFTELFKHSHNKNTDKISQNPVEEWSHTPRSVLHSRWHSCLFTISLPGVCSVSASCFFSDTGHRSYEQQPQAFIDGCLSISCNRHENLQGHGDTRYLGEGVGYGAGRCL